MQKFSRPLTEYELECLKMMRTILPPLIAHFPPPDKDLMKGSAIDTEKWMDMINYMASQMVVGAIFEAIDVDPISVSEEAASDKPI